MKSKRAAALFFKPEAAVKRIKRLGDLFAPVLKLRQTLSAAFTKALASGPPPKLSSWPRNRSKTGRDHDQSLREYCPFVNLPEKKASRWGEALGALPAAVPLSIFPPIDPFDAFRERDSLFLLSSSRIRTFKRAGARFSARPYYAMVYTAAGDDLAALLSGVGLASINCGCGCSIRAP